MSMSVSVCPVVYHQQRTQPQTVIVRDRRSHGMGNMTTGLLHAACPLLSVCLSAKRTTVASVGLSVSGPVLPVHEVTCSASSGTCSST